MTTKKNKSKKATPKKSKKIPLENIENKELAESLSGIFRDDNSSIENNEFSIEEYTELLGGISKLEAILANKFNTIVSIKTATPIVFNGTIIDNPFMSECDPQLDSVDPFFDADTQVIPPLLSELKAINNGKMIFEHLDLKDCDKKEIQYCFHWIEC